MRAALDRDSRWKFTTATPLRPWGDPERQHLIVWVDITRTDAEKVLREGVYDIVTNEIPGAILVGILETSL